MLDLRATMLAATAAINIGAIFFIYFRRQSSPTTTLFTLFLLAIVCWAMLWFYYFVGTPIVSYYALKFSYTAALAIAFTFYLFSVLFPGNTLPSRNHTLIISSITVILAVFLSTPGTLVISTSYDNGSVYAKLIGSHFLIFTLAFISYYVVSMTRLWLKSRNSNLQAADRSQLLFILASASLVGFLGIYFDLILGSPYLNDFRYLWTGPLFTTLIAITTMYAIFRLKLFSTKAVASELFVFFVWGFTFVRMLLAADPTEKILNGGLFVLLLGVGLLLIRSVNKEVEQRETIEQQKQELEKANQQQTSLLHFISHEIKGYLTKSEAAFAGIIEGDFGKADEGVTKMSQSALGEVRKGVATVMDILDAANLKKGTVSYAKKFFDLKQAVESIVDDLKPSAEEKKLTIEMDVGDGSYTMMGDEDKFRRHVIRNLIDNAIKYTPKGSISVKLEHTRAAMRLTIQDSGVGITPEDMAHLFTEGGHGKDSIKVNAQSTGYGLYIAKQIVEAHKGKIWAESDGQGKGSRFIIDIPTQ